MNEQELNRKLAEWAGFKPNSYYFDGLSQAYEVEDYLYPEGYKDWRLPSFTQSLDACFKWLVPKYVAEVCLLPMGLTSIMSIYTFLFAEWLKVMDEKVEPALALCLAIEKLIDNEMKG